MAITTLDSLVNAMGNTSSRLVIDKASLANQLAGLFSSLWRATGQPGQGAIPTTTAVPTHATTGALGFAQQTAPAASYLALLEGLNSNAAMTLEIHDRLAHMGGLSGIVTTAQTVGMDLSAILGTSNLDARKGDANYSDVQWWLEWYTDTGSTAVNITVNVTFNDDSSANLLTLALPATRRIGMMYPLNGLIQAADSGKFIRDVNTVTLSATTGTAGNFGVTATRYRAGMFMPIANARFTNDWQQLGLPEIPNSACLFPVLMNSTTSTGTLRATGKIIHG